MLTDPKIRNAKAKSKPYKLADGEGLYVYISASGAKSWRYDYRLFGKRETDNNRTVPGYHGSQRVREARSLRKN